MVQVSELQLLHTGRSFYIFFKRGIVVFAVMQIETGAWSQNVMGLALVSGMSARVEQLVDK